MRYVPTTAKQLEYVCQKNKELAFIIPSSIGGVDGEVYHWHDRYRSVTGFKDSKGNIVNVNAGNLKLIAFWRDEAQIKKDLAESIAYNYKRYLETKNKFNPAHLLFVTSEYKMRLEALIKSSPWANVNQVKQYLKTLK